MAYCSNCGANIDAGANFCPSCGARLNSSSTQSQSSDTSKTVATIAGTAIGVSVLSRMMHRRRRHMIMPPPPHRGPMGAPHRGGPMGGPHHRGPRPR